MGGCYGGDNGTPRSGRDSDDCSTGLAEGGRVAAWGATDPLDRTMQAVVCHTSKTEVSILCYSIRRNYTIRTNREI